MFGGSGAPSLADIAAVTDNNRNCNDGFGGGNGWWVLIILFAIFGGWGRGGYGCGYGNGDSGGGFAATQADIQRGFDTQSIIDKLNGINSGLCDGFYAMNTSMLNGFNNNNMAILQGNFGLQQAINADTVANMQNTNALQTQLADCCCQNKQGQAQIQYQMATDTCAITTAVNQAAQNIMQNDNANYRQLHDEMVANRLSDKDETINQLRQQLFAYTLNSSQANQTNELINTLRPQVNPAYIVQNPYAGTGYFPCQQSGCC